MNSLFDLIEHSGICRMLLYYLDHPNQVRRVDYRKKPLSLSGSKSETLHKILLNSGLIKPVPNEHAVMFGLTEKGLFLAHLIREIQYKEKEFQSLK